MLIGHCTIKVQIICEIGCKSSNTLLSQKNTKRVHRTALIITTIYTSVEAQRRLIIQALAHWEEYTCVRFVKKTTERDYILIWPDYG